MSVFRNYDKTKAGDVNANAFPNVHVYPWVPSQRSIRSNPNIPSQPQRIQPHERGTFFPTSATAGGTLAPAMSSGCGSCAGCSGGCAGAVVPDKPVTASEVATAPTVVGPVVPRAQQRGVGALRPSLARPAMSLSPRRSMIRGFMGR
jgi:hypothetical protein